MTNSLWLALAITLGVRLTPWGSILLYPFTLFTTWAHECGHALMTAVVHGSVYSIAIRPDTSGLTHSVIPASRAAQALVASSGYLGASLVGCALLSASRQARRAPTILWTVGALMLVTILTWIRNPFGIAVVLAWGVALMALARTAGGDASRFVLSLLAIQVALNAVYDIRVLFLVTGGHSDADTMARLFALPAWIWASVWMLVSIAMLGWTLTRSK